MNGYEPFAPFYDRVMGDASDNSQWLLDAMERWAPDARSLLELGCGTGSVLAGLATMDSLTGLDASEAMLAVARTKVPGARLVVGDIADFTLDERFDVIACVFDTINHLTTLAQWVSALECTAAHLVPGGLFCFDVNTLGRLEELSARPPWVHQFEGGTLTMTVVDEGAGLTSWHIAVVEPGADGNGVLRETVVQELALPLDVVRAALSADFEILEEEDGSGERPNDDSPRARFVCRSRL